jgi:hypothetical protein
MKTEPTSTEPQDIYRQLKKGLGHELVTDANVFELIALAKQDGHQLLETELREWQSPCGPNDSNLPSTIAPTAGFNKEHVKH